MAAVKVFGADWCPMTTHTLHFLDQNGVSYEYIDIEANAEAAAWVASQAGGKEKKPTLDVGGETLVTPSNAHLGRVLRDKGLLA